MERQAFVRIWSNHRVIANSVGCRYRVCCVVPRTGAVGRLPHASSINLTISENVYHAESLHHPMTNGGDFELFRKLSKLGEGQAKEATYLALARVPPEGSHRPLFVPARVDVRKTEAGYQAEAMFSNPPELWTTGRKVRKTEGEAAQHAASELFGRLGEWLSKQEKRSSGEGAV